MAGNVTFDDRGWHKYKRRIAAFAGAHVKVGVLASKRGLDKSQTGEITMIELAAIHEFGSPAANIPERSFIRRTFHEQAGELGTLLENLARGVATGKIAHTRALAILGLWGVTQVRKTITDGTGVPPPLQQATIDRKGSSRPLVDTGRLINAITYEVVEVVEGVAAAVVAVVDDEGIAY